MSTKADVHDGRGPHARWLGSLQTDADLKTVRTIGCERLALTATDPITFADAMADLLDVWKDEGCGHGYHPTKDWPWLWPDSGHTDWVYAYDRRRVWLTNGCRWVVVDPDAPELPTAITAPRCGSRHRGEHLVEMLAFPAMRSQPTDRPPQNTPRRC